MKIMRLKHAKLLIILIVFANIVLFYYSWKSFLWKTIFDFQNPSSLSSAKLLRRNINNNGNNYVFDMSLNKNNNKDQQQQNKENKIKSTNKHIRKAITIVFRNFYNFENDLKSSINSILGIIPNIQILILQDTIPYPPIVFYENNSTTLMTGINGGSNNRKTIENNVKFFNFGFDISKTSNELSPLSLIKTKYVLFMPDSVRLNNKSILQKILREFNSKLQNQNVNNNSKDEHSNKKIIIIPFAGNTKSFTSCCEINLDLPNWTIEYTAVNTNERCDLYLQKHAIFVDSTVLLHMPDALSSPFPEMFYIQAKIANITKVIFPISLQDGKKLFTSYHSKQRRMDIRKKQFKEMYKKLQIKRIIRKTYKWPTSASSLFAMSLASSSSLSSLKTEMLLSNKDSILSMNSNNNNNNINNNNINNNPHHNLLLDVQFSLSNFSLPLSIETILIGCERNTKSCIGSVYNMKPFYLYLNKHTPPCCLEKLKSVFHHVIDELENVGMRYWLDNVALKSAIEIQQLSLDSYEIDISFNSDDLERSNSLKKSQQRPFTDIDGYYWLKATDGLYFRVQYSKINQIGVNLLPFNINGNNVKPNGFYGWKAKEFSSEFLHPMSTVLFLGKNVMCPNNVREYLEYKNIN